MSNSLRDKKEYLVGIDEAGRGPLAGPVAIGTSCISKENSKKIFSLLKKHGLNDSKQVKELDREKLHEIICKLKKEGLLDFAVVLISADIISKKGISYAIQLGIDRNLKTILARHPHVDEDPGVKSLDPRLRGDDVAYAQQQLITLELDGALKIPQGDWKKASVIIKGDSIKPSIMIASIVAKVTRDRHMKKLSKKYPKYGFEVHKGYGTKRHRECIKKYGLSKEHRVGWCKI
ncbi:MAG: ribonuclease ribonuclease [Candidatus Parcubacteria bacterium]|jgi:ribonuclease HII